MEGGQVSRHFLILLLVVVKYRREKFNLTIPLTEYNIYRGYLAKLKPESVGDLDALAEGEGQLSSSDSKEKKNQVHCLHIGIYFKSVKFCLSTKFIHFLVVKVRAMANY